MSQMLPAKGFRSVSRSLLRRLARFAARGKRVAICLGLLVTIFTLWLQIDAPELARDLIQRLEYLVYDQRLSIMPKPVKSAANKISIIDLDERSLQAEGQYPWNRIKVGQLVEKLRDNGVLVVGFDITFQNRTGISETCWRRWI